MWVHKGFADVQAESAVPILAAVIATFDNHGPLSPSVTVVGHSTGAALGLLDAVFLKLRFSSSVEVRYIGFGLPRVGNQAFADYVDQHITLAGGGTSLKRINNKEDPIPVTPSRSLGFVHPRGEIHIQDSNAWVACSGRTVGKFISNFLNVFLFDNLGQDNGSKLCIVGDVTSVSHGKLSEHNGPYDGVTMGC